MPKDKRAKVREIEKRFQKKTYHTPVLVRFRQLPPDDLLHPALVEAAADGGIGMAAYCREAVREKLLRDGYLKD